MQSFVSNFVGRIESTAFFFYFITRFKKITGFFSSLFNDLCE